MSAIRRIRQRVLECDYYLSSHAEEEMQQDGLGRADIEGAILNGRVEKKLTEDVRGIRYRITGSALDGRKIYLVCRFKVDGELIIITVYQKAGSTMICEFCGGRTRKRKVTKQHWLEGRLYIVENVTAEACSGCGERYYHAKELDRIDRLLKEKHRVKSRIHVEVVALA